MRWRVIMARWIVQEDKEGAATLWRDRKRVSVHSTAAAATRAAHSQMDKDDLLYHEAHDGYRTRLRGKRRGWRQPR